MHSAALNVAALSALALQVSAKTIPIKVGNGGLSFDPPSVTASVGDVLEYHFYASQHSVVLGDYKKGCSPAADGFYSGMIKTSSGKANDEVFRVTVKNTDPMFVYCSYAKHCQGGMVGAVNPSSDMTLDAYQKTTASSTENVSPDSVSGGVLAKADSPVAGGSSSSSSDASKSASKTEDSTSKGNASATKSSESTATTPGSESTSAPATGATDSKTSGAAPTGSKTSSTAPSSTGKSGNAAGNLQAATGAVAAVAMGVVAVLAL